MSESNRKNDGDTQRRDTASVPASTVREDDLEPHAGLRYIARLFKVLAILMVLLLIAEIIIALSQHGSEAIGTLLVSATRMIVFAATLWAGGDMVLMFIESNHDLRATRILLGRVNAQLEELDPGKTAGGTAGPSRPLP